MIICDKDYVFLGSRLGNSLLLRLGERGTVREIIDQTEVNGDDKNGDSIVMEDLTEDDDDEIIRLKRSRMALDQEEVEVYGSEKKTHFVIKTYGLEVCKVMTFENKQFFFIHVACAVD